APASGPGSGTKVVPRKGLRLFRPSKDGRGVLVFWPRGAAEGTGHGTRATEDARARGGGAPAVCLLAIPGLLPRARRPRPHGVLRHPPAAEGDGRAAQGPRPSARDPRPDRAPEADAGTERPLPAGHRPRRDRDP